MSVGGAFQQGAPRIFGEAAMDPTSHLGRADIASHLKLSTRSVDRFIEHHGLRSALGRLVLVRRESYARCLVGLRYQSTHSMAPPVRPGMPAPVPLQPGEELILASRTDGSGPLLEAFRQWAGGCTIRTPDECPPGHWLWPLVDAARAMAGMRRAMTREAARPTPGGNPEAAQYFRRLLHEAHAYGGQPLDAAVLARTLRRLPMGERLLVLEALAGEVVNAACEAAGAPLDYVHRPVLTEHELASEVRRNVGTVRRWRVEGTGPVFLRIERAVRYSWVDVDAWLGERLVR